MNLSEYLPEQQIVTQLNSENKFEIIEELLDVLQRNQRLLDRETARKDVIAREGYLSTGLENGLAIPHAKTDGVDGLVIALGLKTQGVDFESLDGKPAQIIFLVLSPRDTSGPHIQSLAVISRNLKDKAKRETLLQASSEAEAARIIREQFTA